MYLDISDQARKRSRRDGNDTVHSSSFDQVEEVEEVHSTDVSFLADQSLGSLQVDHRDNNADQSSSTHHDDDGGIPLECEHETMQSPTGE